MLQLITLLNRCHHFPGFVYQRSRFSSNHKSIEIAVRPRKGSAAICSRCHQPALGYDELAERRFEFIPFWGSIRAWLGHVSLDTTHVYAEVDMEMKATALASVDIKGLPQNPPGRSAMPSLMAFLRNL